MDEKSVWNKQPVISVKDLSVSGVHWESAENFKESIFSTVYESAQNCVREIVKKNVELSKKIEMCKEEQDVEIQNVISFIGRRGTGKSSSMLSFREALKGYDGAIESDRLSLFYGKKDMDNVRFIYLNSIDTAILDASEDVFILVLANLFAEINKELDRDCESVKGFTKRDIVSGLERVYTDFTTIRRKCPNDLEGQMSAYETLKGIVSTKNVRDTFAKLVEKFLKYKKNLEKDDCKSAYLVITLDDLDMAYYNDMGKNKCNNAKSYEIMNHILKYLSVPGVIVLASYNHVNLYQQCAYFFKGKNTSKLDENKEDKAKSVAAELASEYMVKVFPIHYRIYMPSWKKMDFEEQRPIINLMETNPKDMNSEGIDPEFMNFLRGEQITKLKIKDFVLELYAWYLEIYYDPFGKKRHFLEPNSLRELNETYRMFTDRENRATEREEILFEKVKLDVYHRFIEERLSLPEEKRIMKAWLELSIERRSEDIVQKISGEIIPLGKYVKRYLSGLEAERNLLSDNPHSDEERVQEIDRILSRWKTKEVNYSYAELVHCIYHITRQNSLYSREMVACILQVYTVYLTQCYRAYQTDKWQFDPENYQHIWRQLDKEPFAVIEKDDDKAVFNRIEKRRKLFKEVIGESVCGKWTEYYFPELWTDREPLSKKIPVIMGYAEDVDFEFEFSITDGEGGSRKLIEEFIFFTTMYTNLLEWSEIQVKYRNKFEGVSKVIVSYKGKTDFELTAFLKYTFLYEEYLRKLESLAGKLFEKNKEDPSWLESFKEQGSKQCEVVFEELWKKYTEWDWKYGNMAIPIQNFDLAYNMIKRLFKTGKIENNRTVNMDENGVLVKEYEGMLNRFKKYLGDIDEKYHLGHEDSKNNDAEKSEVNKKKRKTVFQEIFEKCPFVNFCRKDLGKYQEDASVFFRAIAMKIIDKQSIFISPDD